MDERAIGIDVSSYQSKIDWRIAAAGVGCSFAWARLLEGVDLDLSFLGHFARAKEAGLLAGAYVYFRARHEGGEQADLALEQLANAEASAGAKAELPVALDLETLDGQSPWCVLGRATAFLDALRKAGRRVVVYTGPGFFDTLTGVTEGIASAPLWLADYRGTPRPPHAWKAWTFWQYTSDFYVGLEKCDASRFAGTLPELRRWLSDPAEAPADPGPATPRNDA